MAQHISVVLRSYWQHRREACILGQNLNK